MKHFQCWNEKREEEEETCEQNYELFSPNLEDLQYVKYFPFKSAETLI